MVERRYGQRFVSKQRIAHTGRSSYSHNRIFQSVQSLRQWMRGARVWIFFQFCCIRALNERTNFVRLKICSASMSIFMRCTSTQRSHANIFCVFSLLLIVCFYLPLSFCLSLSRNFHFQLTLMQMILTVLCSSIGQKCENIAIFLFSRVWLNAGEFTCWWPAGSFLAQLTQWRDRDINRTKQQQQHSNYCVCCVELRMQTGDGLQWTWTRKQQQHGNIKKKWCSEPEETCAMASPADDMPSKTMRKK